MPIIQRIEVRCDLMGFWLFYFMENEIEIWKDVVDCEGLYFISNFGRVRNATTSKTLKPSLTIDGYLKYSLSKNGKTINGRINVMVARAFIDPDYVKKGLVCDHLDNNKENNFLSNLDIKTNRANILKSIDVSKGSSVHIGVSFYKRSRKWKASISGNNKRIYLGTFNTEEEANEAYKLAAVCVEDGRVSDIKIKRREPKCVCFIKRTNKWQAYITVNLVKKHIGTYETEQEAKQAYIDFLSYA